MPSRLQKKRAQNKKYYLEITKKSFHCRRVKIMLLTVILKSVPQKNIVKLIKSKEWHTIASIMKPTKRRQRLVLMTITLLTKKKLKLIFVSIITPIGIKERPPFMNIMMLTRMT